MSLIAMSAVSRANRSPARAQEYPTADGGPARLLGSLRSPRIALEPAVVVVNKVRAIV
jgi:hypothetical protein